MPQNQPQERVAMESSSQSAQKLVLEDLFLFAHVDAGADSFAAARKERFVYFSMQRGNERAIAEDAYEAIVNAMRDERVKAGDTDHYPKATDYRMLYFFGLLSKPAFHLAEHIRYREGAVGMDQNQELTVYYIHNRSRGQHDLARVGSKNVGPDIKGIVDFIESGRRIDTGSILLKRGQSLSFYKPPQEVFQEFLALKETIEKIEANLPTTEQIMEMPLTAELATVAEELLLGGRFGSGLLTPKQLAEFRADADIHTAERQRFSSEIVPQS